MNNNEQTLKRDLVWNPFLKNSYEYFEELSSGVCFIPEVSQEVVKRFDVVKPLIRYSSFEYQFPDVAFERALGSFELALKMRYKEIEGKDPGKKELELTHVFC